MSAWMIVFDVRSWSDSAISGAGIFPLLPSPRVPLTRVLALIARGRPEQLSICVCDFGEGPLDLADPNDPNDPRPSRLARDDGKGASTFTSCKFCLRTALALSRHCDQRDMDCPTGVTDF